jgi:TetR/AcrR family transcriptional regulator, transcriptional repressor for nem operon
VVREERSREKILQAAETLFHRRGFQPTSLEELLEASGVCRSNFYYHFQSKEDLGLEVLARLVERFEARVIRGILEDESVPARRRLETLFHTLREGQREVSYSAGCPFGNLAAELSGVHPQFRDRLSVFFRRWEDALERCLRDGMARAEFRQDLDTRLMALAIMGQIEGAFLLSKAHRDGEPIDAGAQMVLQLLESR